MHASRRNITRLCIARASGNELYVRTPHNWACAVCKNSSFYIVERSLMVGFTILLESIWIYNCLLCEQQSSILLYLTDHASSPQPSLPPLLIISLVKTVIIFFWTHTLMEPLASFTDHHPRYLLLAVRNLRIVLHYHWRGKLQQCRKYQQTPAFAVVHDQQRWCSSW